MHTQRTTLRLCLWTCLVAICWADQLAPLTQLAQNPCSSKTTCSDCIRAASCAWCFAAEFNGPRCFYPALEGGNAGCNEAYIFNPDNELSVDQAYNKELSRTLSHSSSSSGSYGGSGSFGAGGSPGGVMSTAGSGENLVQIKPQRVNLQLRQNQMQELSFAYSRAQDYPLGHIQGSSSGVLTENSDNIVDLVRDQYKKITSAVEITDTSSDAIEIVYYSSCLEKNNFIQTNKCDGLRVGDVVEFTAEITLKECPKDPSMWKQTFVIYPGVISEGLTVELEMQCDCPCEHRGHHAYDDSPDVCSGHGISACGMCACQPGSFGKHCECAGGGSADQDHGCRPANASSGAVCSGRGYCICGVCECNKMSDPTEVIYGPFCECENFSCDRYKGLMCSGPEHGECVCGKCQCKPEYTGSACECLVDTKSCIPPGGGEICRGNGQCVCGHCVCNLNSAQQYFGKYCDICPTCTPPCEKFKECVLCMVYHRGAEWNDVRACFESCKKADNIYPFVELGKLEVNESRNEHLCSFQDEEDDCRYVFVYSTYLYNYKQEVVIRAQKQRECPKKIQGTTKGGETRN